MAYEEEGVIWKASDDGDDDDDDYEIKGSDFDDVWDDTALIKAYDKAVAKLKEEIHSESSVETAASPDVKTKKRKKKTAQNKKKESAKKPSWKSNEKCLALYSDDNLYYEATILSVNQYTHTVYVRFDYYENEEEVNMSDLLPVECKAELKPATDDVYYESEKSCKTDDDKPSESSQDEKCSSKELKNWCISDLCYAQDDTGTYQQAVLNSFVSSNECNVTFVHSKTRKQVNVSKLKEKPPKMNNQGVKDNLRFNTTWNLPPGPPSQGLFSQAPFQMSDIFPGTSSAFPQQLPPFHDWSQPHPAYPVSRIPPPPPPPPPILSDEVIGGDEEALANMLMSWYMSGYHTGYYRGITQQQKHRKVDSTKQKKKQT